MPCEDAPGVEVWHLIPRQTCARCKRRLVPDGDIAAMWCWVCCWKTNPRRMLADLLRRGRRG